MTDKAASKLTHANWLASVAANDEAMPANVRADCLEQAAKLLTQAAGEIREQARETSNAGK